MREKGYRMKHKIKTLKAFVGGFMGPSYKVKINLETEFAIYNVSDSGYIPKDTETIELSKEKIETFLKTLETIKIDKWKKNYENTYVLDGTSWNLEITFGNNKKLSFTGNNAYPYQWKTFCNSIQKLLGKTFG